MVLISWEQIALQSWFISYSPQLCKRVVALGEKVRGSQDWHESISCHKLLPRTNIFTLPRHRILSCQPDDAANPLVSREKRSHHFDQHPWLPRTPDPRRTSTVTVVWKQLSLNRGKPWPREDWGRKSTVSLVPTAISGRHKAVPPTGALLPSKCAWMRHPHHNASAPQLNLHCPALWEGVRSLSCWTRWVESLCQHWYYFVLLTEILSTLSLRNFFIVEVKLWKLTTAFLPKYWHLKKISIAILYSHWQNGVFVLGNLGFEPKIFYLMVYGTLSKLLGPPKPYNL